MIFFGGGPRGGQHCRRTRSEGFSLVDILVSIAVIAVLISILLPSLQRAQSAAQRVVCASHLRDVGITIGLHSEDNRDLVPESVHVLSFVSRSGGSMLSAQPRPERMMAARFSGPSGSWDGLGWLYAREYLPLEDVFYCPAHTGDHPLSRYRGMWAQETVNQTLVTNFQYRGVGPVRVGDPQLLTPLLRNIDPAAAIVTDGLMTQADFNHRDGANVLRAGNDVRWFEDPGREFVKGLPDSDADVEASRKVRDAWLDLDAKVNGFDR